jgi:SAM-dependent methyltransferase
MREKLLAKWVAQPSAPPTIQYLRDAERLASWEHLGRRKRVLDVASEANVTAGLDADEVVRVDFSPDASERARAVLTDAVDRYEQTDPEEPTLPFRDNTFDGAVSIGPFDWKFLDTDALSAELHRVVAPNGLAVLSVPTPRSPYAKHNWPKLRYFTPDEAMELVSPSWRVVDRDPIFQYPHRVHKLIGDLPDRYQDQFVDAARLATTALDSTDWTGASSYLVFALRPMPFADTLDSALSSLFRPTDETGFWNEREGTFVRALRYAFDDEGVGGGFRWTTEDRTEWRYAPFALMGTLQWRASALGTDAYDSKIRRALSYFRDRIDDGTVASEMPSYGVGPLTDAFALAATVFGHDSYLDAARWLFEHATETYEFDHAEDSLLLYGWARLYEQYPSDRLREAIDDALWQVVDRQTASGRFSFDNPTTQRHQNQMYTLWGLCRAIEVTGRSNYLENVERVLDDAVETRMRDDGAFRWMDTTTRERVGYRARAELSGRPDSPPQWRLLFPCHQTFFAVAVAHYRAAGGDKSYARAVRRALAWLYGANARGLDLVAHSGIGVPMRFMTLDGRMDVPEQQFKGTYEVGSLVMATVQLLTGTVGPGRRATSAESDIVTN